MERSEPVRTTGVEDDTQRQSIRGPAREGRSRRTLREAPAKAWDARGKGAGRGQA